jgi:hypothetical protein
MLEIVEKTGNLIHIRAIGEITAKDYETVMIPAVEDTLKHHDKLKMIYELGPEMTGFSPGAAWEDTKVGMSHLTQFEKIAVVTDHHWLVNMVKAFGILVPCPVKVFAPNQVQEAREWTD